MPFTTKFARLACVATGFSLLLSLLLIAPPATAVTYGGEVGSPSSSRPWVVPIYWGKINKASQQICTGSLIDQQVVLTAAHCIDGLEKGTFSIQVGADRLDQGRRIYADGWWINPRYSRARYVNDVALLHLVEPANVSSLGRLATARKVPSKMRIYGWGVDQNGRQSGALMYANLNRQTKTAKRAFGPSYNKTTMVAAGRKIKREGVYAGGCNGDSGGPLVAGTSSRIVGVTAFGALGCDVSVPTVFSKVSYYGKDIARGIGSAVRMAQTNSQAPPRPISGPTITGNVAAGGTAACAPGSWLGVPRSYSYQWTLDGHGLSDRTDTLELDSDTAGQTLTCTVTATGSQGRTGKATTSSIVSTKGSTTPGNSNPTVTWSSPSAGSTITHSTQLQASASASGTASVAKACLTINGQAPTENHADYPLSYVTWHPDTGCWQGNNPANDLKISVDPTGWTNGDYTFAWTVTDSNGRTSTTASRTFRK